MNGFLRGQNISREKEAKARAVTAVGKESGKFRSSVFLLCLQMYGRCLFFKCFPKEIGKFSWLRESSDQ